MSAEDVRMAINPMVPICDANGTPFWNTNLLPSLHTPECSSYLEYVFRNEKDRCNLLTPNVDFRRLTWAEVRSLIETNDLGAFVRTPRDIRRYRKYCSELETKYGSIMKFVLQERLHWTDLKPGGEPFQFDEDLKIMHNDWPYGIDKRIKHLVVWTKFELTADPEDPKGDLVPEAREAIEGFVRKTFGERCGEENVRWFRNWTSLQSIQAVPHFHVMVFDPEEGYVEGVTGGDVPLAEKLGEVS